MDQLFMLATLINQSPILTLIGLIIAIIAIILSIVFSEKVADSNV